MPARSNFCPLRKWALSAALGTLAFSVACSRPEGLRGNAPEPKQTEQRPPFHGEAVDSGGQTDNPDQRPVPFKKDHARGLPAGTLLTVRLDNSLSSKRSASGTFTAVVDEPIVIDGTTLVPSGAPVRGRVESALVSEVDRETGYVRLTLDSVTIDGRGLPLQTSSLFARGRVRDNAGSTATDQTQKSIDLKKGRHLTFRLTAAFTLPEDGSLSGSFQPARSNPDGTSSPQLTH